MHRAPQVLSLSPHRALKLFRASDLICLRNWIFLWRVLSEDHCYTGDCDLPERQNTMSTQRTYPDDDVICWVFCCLRLPQLFSTCVAFSLWLTWALGEGP